MKKVGSVMHRTGSLVLIGLISAIGLSGCGKGTKRKVYFGNLEDGSNVESPFRVEMKAENLVVEPAEKGVTEGHGHFHIIVDAPLASPAEPMVKDEKHIHYGAGESEAVVNLPVGQHTLILQFAKGDHVPYDPPLYQQVQVNFVKVNAAPADTAAASQGQAPADTAAKPAPVPAAP